MKLFRSTHRRALVSVLVVLVLAASVSVMGVGTADAATSPTLVGAAGYSALGGQAVTCIAPTTTSGAAGVSPLTSIDFPPCGPAGGGVHSNDASTIAAQADALAAFGTLAQPCTQNYPGGQDLSLVSPLGPGVYCSPTSLFITGNLTLTGSGVWIFQTGTTLVTSSGSSVIGGDPCNIWWRIGSAATLGTTTSFIGTIVAQNGSTALQTGATLNGRVLVLSAGTLTLDANTISGPVCGSSGGSGGSGGSGSGGSTPPLVAELYRLAPHPKAVQTVGSILGASMANSGQRLRDLIDSLCISATAPGSSSPGRVSIHPSRYHGRPSAPGRRRCGRW